MKRLLSLLCAIALLLCGCAQNPEEELPTNSLSSASSSALQSDSEVMPEGNPYADEPDASLEEHTVEALTEKGKLVVAVQSDHVPYSFMSSDGILCGYETSLVQQLGDTLGVAAELLPVSEEEALWDAVRSGAADVALGAWTEQADAEEAPVTLCAQYDGEYGVLVRIEDKPKYNISANFDGHAIAYLKTDENAPTLAKEDLWDSELLEMESVESALRKLRSGSCDGALMSLPLAQKCENQNMDLGVCAVRFAEIPRAFERYVYVLNGNDSLINVMEKAVAEALKLGMIGEWMLNAENVLAVVAG